MHSVRTGWISTRFNSSEAAPLQQAIEHGRIAAPADLSQQGEIYRIGGDALAELGWRQISNSHWARTQRERNRYNRLIKQGADCLAYGAGAGGSIGQYSYSLTADLSSARLERHLHDTLDHDRDRLSRLNSAQSEMLIFESHTALRAV
jgi:coproporphyrinogen III oxidase-like Fe-S oxidoreductase